MTGSGDMAQLADAAVAAWQALDAAVRREECGGIPVWWTPVPGPLHANLVFRTGRADETFARAGITHLVEHLALSAIGEQSYNVNGSVSGEVTSFSVEGDEDEVVDFLATVCARLHDLPADRFDAERTVLRTEESRRDPNLTAALFFLRYGSRSWGLLDCPEHALRAAGFEEVQAWAHARFVAGNAALLLSGPPPRGLRLPLPPGERIAQAPAVPLQQAMPAYVKRASNLVGLSAVLEPGPATSAFARQVQRCFAQRLRGEQGVTYSVNGSADRVGPQRRHLTMVADTLPEQATQVVSTMLAELDRMAVEGVSSEDLAHDLDQLRRMSLQPLAAIGLAHRQLIEHLHGDERPPVADAVRRVAALSAGDIAERAAAARDSSLWLIPQQATVPAGRFHAYEEWSRTRVTGAPFAPRRRPLTSVEPVSLVLGEDGATLVMPQDHCVTVHWSECVGLLAWSSGERGLFSSDGFRIVVDPVAWDRAVELITAIDRRVPASAVIPMGPSERAQQRIAAGVAPGWDPGPPGTNNFFMALTPLLRVAMLLAVAAVITFSLGTNLSSGSDAGSNVIAPRTITGADGSRVTVVQPSPPPNNPALLGLAIALGAAATVTGAVAVVKFNFDRAWSRTRRPPA